MSLLDFVFHTRFVGLRLKLAQLVHVSAAPHFGQRRMPQAEYEIGYVAVKSVFLQHAA